MMFSVLCSPLLLGLAYMRHSTCGLPAVMQPAFIPAVCRTSSSGILSLVGHCKGGWQRWVRGCRMGSACACALAVVVWGYGCDAPSHVGAHNKFGQVQPSASAVPLLCVHYTHLKCFVSKWAGCLGAALMVATGEGKQLAACGDRRTKQPSGNLELVALLGRQLLLCCTDLRVLFL